MANKPGVLLNWHLSDMHGWGIAGTEIFSYMALKSKYQPAMGYPIKDIDVRGMDNLRKSVLLPSFRASNNLNKQIVEAIKDDVTQEVTISLPVIHALGNQFSLAGCKLTGSTNLGRIVIELDNLSQQVAQADKYDAFIVASTWNQRILQSVTDKPVWLNHEGVDTTRFHPGPKCNLFSDDDFLIFSGGKVEYRKAQDIVLSVFKRFAQNKPNVKLVTAWQSTYAKHISDGFTGILDIGLEVNDNAIANIQKWAADNGVNPEQVIDLGQVPHHTMPYVLREMDAALQLSRAEGGTNFVAMECMACGIPTLISRCTGHLDIIDYPNAIAVDITAHALNKTIDGASDWREVDIDDAVEKLETLYKLKKVNGTTQGTEGFPRTWVQHSQDLEQIVSHYAI